MSAEHAAHVAHRFLESTKVGHQITASAVGATVGVAHLLGGTALAGVAAAVAPVAVPIGLVIGAAVLARKVMGKDH